MIVIHTSHNDTSTNDVLDWLYFLGRNDIKRLNDEIFIDSLEIDDDICIYAGDDTIALSEVSSYWYRRGIMKSKGNNGLNKDAFTVKLSIPLQSEIDRIYSAMDFFKGKNSIGKYSDNSIDKVQMLLAAKRSGLKIPKTLITGSPKKLEKFILKCDSGVITKAVDISSLTVQSDEDYHRSLSLSTRIIDNENFKHLYFDSAVPALFQEYIDKKFEIRIFYLNEKFYSMAIFSQQNEKTKVDFRHYDDQHPNRMITYQLPVEIQNKIILFMDDMGLKTGSIDMIYSLNGECVFLEVNPIGQYQWMEKKCNYPISREIAKALNNG